MERKYFDDSEAITPALEQSCVTSNICAKWSAQEKFLFGISVSLQLGSTPMLHFIMIYVHPLERASCYFLQMTPHRLA